MATPYPTQTALEAARQQVRELTSKVQELREENLHLVEENAKLKNAHKQQQSMMRSMSFETPADHVLQVDRRMSTGEVGMVTHGQVGTIMPGECYRILTSSVELVCDDDVHVLELPEPTVPPYIAVENGWQTKAATGGKDEANILGGNKLFLTASDDYTIPHGHDTAAEFAFYGCHLVPVGTVVNFDTPQAIPVTQMSVGDRYVEDYLLQADKGGGFYMEYHSCPHLHCPMDEDAGGFIILARVTPDKRYYFVSAFHIPFGYAVYMPPYVVHCDAFLTGDYMVAYTAARHFNTGLWRYHPSLAQGSVYEEDKPDVPQDELRCTRIHIWCERVCQLFDLTHSKGTQPRLGGRHIVWGQGMPLANPRLHNPLGAS